MISHEIADSCFLDLFSGSGAIGIEALSRGAKEAVFVEQNRKAMACIRENLTFTKLAKQSVLLENGCFERAKRLEGSISLTIFLWIHRTVRCWKSRC